MNLPNKLTLLRIGMIPMLIVVSLIPTLQQSFVIWDITTGNFMILLLFVIAACTDFLDGYIARKYHLITDFGKFMDPLADKLLVLAAMIILLEQGKFTAFGLGLGFVITLILAREFMVTGIRLLVAGKDVVIAASTMGKAKTVSQVVMIIILFLNGNPISLFGGIAKDLTVLIVISIAGILTVTSGVDYLWKNKKYILSEK